MKKILSLVLAAAVSLTLLAACGTQGAKETGKGLKTIKIAHGASESYHMHRAWLKFKEELEKGGKFKVEIYPSSQFG
ncbi:MAG: C4-dicarboxylate-binding protein DctP, partial [Clostridiales bacterium]|nr:C4-dicarboxylate-binding protein DctP [Clostridiales bacterium]